METWPDAGSRNQATNACADFNTASVLWMETQACGQRLEPRELVGPSR